MSQDLYKKIFGKPGVDKQQSGQDKKSTTPMGRNAFPYSVPNAANKMLEGNQAYIPLADRALVDSMVAGGMALQHQLGLSQDQGMSPTPYGNSELGYSEEYDPNDISQRPYNPNGFPKTITRNNISEIVIDINASGSYIFNGYINQTPVLFLIDTGASAVAVPQRIAMAAGLKPHGKSIDVKTANGAVSATTAEIDQLKIGDITLRFTPAIVNPGDNSETVLLGMSALKHFEFTQNQSQQFILRFRG